VADAGAAQGAGESDVCNKTLTRRDGARTWRLYTSTRTAAPLLRLRSRSSFNRSRSSPTAATFSSISLLTAPRPSTPSPPSSASSRRDASSAAATSWSRWVTGVMAERENDASPPAAAAREGNAEVPE